MEVTRLSDSDYEKLSHAYEECPPELSGKPGFLTTMREETLVTELLSPEFARFVLMKAKAMSLSPAEVIQYSLKEQLIRAC